LRLENDERLDEKVSYRRATIEEIVQENTVSVIENEEKKEEESTPNLKLPLFDLVCCSEVIEHVKDKKLFLE